MGNTNWQFTNFLMASESFISKLKKTLVDHNIFVKYTKLNLLVGLK